MAGAVAVQADEAATRNFVCSNLGSDFTDSISSFRINPGFACKFYDNTNCNDNQGDLDDQTGQIADLRTIGWNDRIASVWRNIPLCIYVVVSYGSNGILLAAAESTGIKTLEWLYGKGVSIDQSNHYRRLSLMEAGLWDRLETVQWLINYGARRRA
ncbi:hypothetical protein OIDMADRAFT_29786 [Oidiodendron maius Zn]|uniref:Uncharacterized protein n=1 Tax=Oidiodendron maius (strain Zn) TaxID=913774 RepID=A0A0C3HEH5_OIDMZ|nr:hypothetical protein OIDMADRAFT_29786 [Oidiodendron maius Zn]